MIVCLIIRRCLSLSTSRIGCWHTHSCSIVKIHVINKIEVGYVKKPQVCCYDEVWRLATKQFEGCAAAHTLWYSVLFCRNWSWFSAFDLMKNLKYVFDMKSTEVYDCQKLSILWFDKVIVKIKRCSFFDSHCTFSGILFVTFFIQSLLRFTFSKILMWTYFTCMVMACLSPHQPFWKTLF